MGWLTILINWLIWARMLAEIPPGGSAESPDMQITLQNGAVFRVRFLASRVG